LFNLLSRTRKKSTELEVDRQSPYGTNFLYKKSDLV